jgi:hypothetical protein
MWWYTISESDQGGFYDCAPRTQGQKEMTSDIDRTCIVLEYPNNDQLPHAWHDWHNF